MVELRSINYMHKVTLFYSTWHHGMNEQALATFNGLLYLRFKYHKYYQGNCVAIVMVPSTSFVLTVFLLKYGLIIVQVALYHRVGRLYK